MRQPPQKLVKGCATRPCSFFTVSVSPMLCAFHLAMFSSHVPGSFTGA